MFSFIVYLFITIETGVICDGECGWREYEDTSMAYCSGGAGILSKFFLVIAFVLLKIKLNCLHLEIKDCQEASTYLLSFSPEAAV